MMEKGLTENRAIGLLIAAEKRARITRKRKKKNSEILLVALERVVLGPEAESEKKKKKKKSKSTRQEKRGFRSLYEDTTKKESDRCHRDCVDKVAL